MLGRTPGVRLLGVSRLYRTRPEGHQGQPDFLNGVARLVTSLCPKSLLGRLKRIEKEVGRRRRFRHGPREIDLDLLLYSRRVLERDGLAVPHPRMHLRGFVLRPLAELAPGGSYDTILLLMNGVALAGTLGAFPRFLRQMGGLLAPGGQLLLDSTDLGTGGDDEDGRYPGEVHFQMEFGGVRGAPFPQLFLDRMTLARIAEMEGWEVEIVWDCDGGEYLARLNRPRHP